MKKEKEKVLIWSAFPPNGRIHADVADLYIWLLSEDKKIAAEFKRKWKSAEKKIEVKNLK